MRSTQMSVLAGGEDRAMATSSPIEWTDATWNPWMGCEKVSPGCAHCYMYREQRQYGHDPSALRRSRTKFQEPLRWMAPRLVFTCSSSEWFHPGADEWRPEAWEIIRETPHLTYQVLTKRPELNAERLPDDWGDGYSNVWLGVSVENSRFTWRSTSSERSQRHSGSSPLNPPRQSLLDRLQSTTLTSPKLTG